ncbi:MAG: caspase family protein, partial [Bacteroidia bacterium]|nr:caspase family protein [Bacteroidia bacterium]
MAVLLVFSVAQGQNSPQAQKAYAKAEKLSAKGKYTEVPALYLKAIQEEKALGDSMDRSFIGKIFYQYARFFLSEDYYGVGAEFFLYSALYYQMGGDTAMAQDALQQASYFSDSTAKYQSQYSAPTDSSTKRYYRIPIRSVLRVSGDTTWFTMNLGKRDSLSLGYEGSVVTIYDKRNPKREVDLFGEAVLEEIDFGRSSWYVVIDEEFKEKNIPLQEGDLLYLKLPSEASEETNLLNELAALGISFKDFNGIRMYDYWLVQNMNKLTSQNAMFEIMRDVVIGTAKTLYDPENNEQDKLMTGGAFKGLNMWEAMLETTTEDVKAFLRFVKDYPGKYMGRNFRIDETYATWIINNTPTSDSENELILKDYKATSTRDDLDNWIQVRGRYLDVAEFDYQVIYDSIYGLANDEQYETAHNLTADWLHVTEVLSLDSLQLEFAVVKSQVYAAEKKHEKAIAGFKKVLETNPDHLSAHWFLGNSYLDNEEFTKALKEYEYIMENADWYAGGFGSYGWTLLKMARNQKSMEYLKKAYTMDSTEATYIMNYAHGCLIMGQDQEARRLYNRLLDNIESEAVFTEGLIADFDFFIDNGRSSGKFNIEKSHMLREWEKHFQYKVKGNEVFEKGKALEEKNQHAKAASLFDEAVAFEKQGLFVRHRLLRNYHRWAAYNYYKSSNHEAALDRYTQAWNINREHINDVELEIGDLQAISNEYSWLDNDLRQEMFRKMQYAAQRKYQNQERSNDLYMVSIGANGTEGYALAERDAIQISDIVKSKSSLVFDNTYVSTFTQSESSVDTIKKSIEWVVAHSKPGDCFVFYFSGYTHSDQILINNDTISNKEILAWISSMSATKKIILIDAANESLVSDYLQSKEEHDDGFTSESVVFLISDGRIEMPEADGGLFTSYLIDGINGRASTLWKKDVVKDAQHEKQIAYVTSKSLEGYMYGHMSTGNLQFELKSYSSGVDFPLTFTNAGGFNVDTVPPMIYIPNVVTSDGKRGGRTKIVTISR